VKDCVFCQIIRGEKQSECVYEDEMLMAFKDMHPQAPVHVLLVPKKHIRSLNDIEEEDRSVISELVFRAREIAANAGIAASGYKLILNVEQGGGQYVFHLHMHLLGGWKEGEHLRIKDLIP
jgi:histidine triad (HIT) family protein